MKKIVIGTKGEFIDLDTLLTTRLLIQANSGGGKSYLIRRLVEQLFGKVQIIIIDPEGEFATLREKFDFVLVGRGGETSADPRSAALLAEKLLELNASAVCDIYELKTTERHRWVKLFLESLINAPKRLWHPVVIIVDEAHVFAPEKGQGDSEAYSAMADLATRGRKRGFCGVFATQRLGKFSKNVSAELQNVLIGSTFQDIDRKRAAETLGVLKSEERGFFNTIKLLEPGNFFALGRAVSKEIVTIKVDVVQTSTPESGKYKTSPPPAPEKIKALLPNLSDLPKEAEEKIITEKALKQEITELKRQLKSIPQVKSEVKNVEVPVLSQKQIDSLISLANKISELTEKFEKELRGAYSIIAGAMIKYQNQLKVPQEVNKPYPPTIYKHEKVNKEQLIIKPVQTPDSDFRLKPGAQRILSALAQWSPNGLTEGQMRSHAGMKNSGSFSQYKSSLRTSGFAEKRGDQWFATKIGIDYAGHDIPDAPKTTQEVLDIWNPKLKPGARRMLEILVRYNGQYISDEQLQSEAEMGNSGSYSQYKSSLKTAQLIVTDKGQLAANSETLFL